MANANGRAPGGSNHCINCATDGTRRRCAPWPDSRLAGAGPAK